MQKFLRRNLLISLAVLLAVLGVTLAVWMIGMMRGRAQLLPLAGAALLLITDFGLVYYVLTEIYHPLQTLIRETEEVLRGLQHGEITVVRDDAIGIMANNFNQIILDSRMKRMELESSNLELASHTEIIEKTYRELDKKVFDLFTLFNIGKEINSTLSQDQIMKITCFTSMGQLGITSIMLLMRESRDSETLVRVYEKGFRDKSEDTQTVKVSDAFFQWLHLNEQCLQIQEIEGKPEFKNEVVFLNRLKTALIAPLTVKKNVIGLLLMGKKLSGEDFSQENKEFVYTLASLAAIALENARLYEEAITDGMTKLYLKRYFEIRLKDELKRAGRYESKVTLMMLDIDHFKRINDQYGHTTGDDVLVSIATAIHDNFRDVDIPARYGGEEFSVIMPEVSKEDAMIAAERLRKNVAALHHKFGGKEESVTISIGLAEFPKDAQEYLTLVQAADAALYRSKQTGRNRTTLA
jgi:diguanylate cyclase (GGDEF)-like protein